MVKEKRKQRVGLWWLTPIILLLLVETIFRLLPENLSGERSLRYSLFEYLESDKPSEKVLVGSSIFFNYIHESQADLKNLAFDGANALTGLKILVETEDRPDVIFVEMGLGSLTQSRGYHSGIMGMYEGHSLTLLRRSLLHCTRRENNLHLILRTWIRGQQSGKTERGYLKVDPVYHRLALARFMDRQKKRDATGYYESLQVKGWLKEQKVLIDELMKGGSRVILVRPPEDRQLYELRERERKIEEEVFSRESYTWLDFPGENDFAYQTTDGLHLTRDSSIKALGIMMRVSEKKLILRNFY